MPELPEVEPARREAETVLLGRTIVTVHCPRDPSARGRDAAARTVRGEPIRHLDIAGRSTAFVPAVQP